MGKSVATIGDVVTTAGSTPFPPADSGGWSPATVIYHSYDQIKAAGRPAIYQAECTFVFSGVVSATGVVVTGQETVKLEALNTKLQSGAKNVLVDGDSAVGNYGNKLEVKAKNPISSR